MGFELFWAVLPGILGLRVFQLIFFEEVLFEAFFIILFEGGFGAGDLVDGHLAEHGAEVGYAFQGLLFAEAFLVLKSGGLKGGEGFFVLDKLLFFKVAVTGCEVERRGRAIGVDDRGLVLDGGGRLGLEVMDGRCSFDEGLGMHLAEGVNASELRRGGLVCLLDLTMFRGNRGEACRGSMDAWGFGFQIRVCNR